jgi:hypothetical protein
MDKTAQAARQTRLAQALRTNLRRRKAGDAPQTVQGEAREVPDPQEGPSPTSSEAEPAT